MGDPRLWLLTALATAAITVLAFLPPLPQPQSYHDFADQRTLLGVPHFLNVASNLPFVFVGALGLWFVCRGAVGENGPFLDPRERWPFAVFFFGVGLAGFGSAYYHLDPNNDRLVWDRLPMAIAFMAFVAANIGDRFGPRWGCGLLAPLVLAGLASVGYWHWTEQQGRGDLRPYYFVQFFPLLGLTSLWLLYPPRYTGGVHLWLTLAWYVAAKVFEHPGDHSLFRMGGIVSGHTIKHLAAAMGAWQVLHWLRVRRSIVSGEMAAATTARPRSGPSPGS